MKVAEYKWRVGKRVKINHPNRVCSGECGIIENDWSGQAQSGFYPFKIKLINSKECTGIVNMFIDNLEIL